MVVEDGFRLARGLGSFPDWNVTGASYLATSVLAWLMQAFVPEAALDEDPDWDPDEPEELLLPHAVATTARATSARLRLPTNRLFATMFLSCKSLFRWPRIGAERASLAGQGRSQQPVTAPEPCGSSGWTRILASSSRRNRFPSRPM